MKLTLKKHSHLLSRDTYELAGDNGHIGQLKFRLMFGPTGKVKLNGQSLQLRTKIFSSKVSLQRDSQVLVEGQNKKKTPIRSQTQSFQLKKLGGSKGYVLLSGMTTAGHIQKRGMWKRYLEGTFNNQVPLDVGAFCLFLIAYRKWKKSQNNAGAVAAASSGGGGGC